MNETLETNEETPSKLSLDSIWNLEESISKMVRIGRAGSAILRNLSKKGRGKETGTMRTKEWRHIPAAQVSWKGVPCKLASRNWERRWSRKSAEVQGPGPMLDRWAMWASISAILRGRCWGRGRDWYRYWRVQKRWYCTGMTRKREDWKIRKRRHKQWANYIPQIPEHNLCSEEKTPLCFPSGGACGPLAQPETGMIASEMLLVLPP